MTDVAARHAPTNRFVPTPALTPANCAISAPIIETEPDNKRNALLVIVPVPAIEPKTNNQIVLAVVPLVATVPKVDR